VKQIKYALLALFLLVGPPAVAAEGAEAAPAATQVAVAEQEIAHLIAFVRASNLSFIRHGRAYTGEKAADHLAMKYRNARAQISSAEAFIANIASKSSATGQPYLMRSPEGIDTPVADWLSAELAHYRTENKPK